MDAESFVGTLFLLFFLVAIVLSVAIFALYILQAIGLSKIAKNEGIDKGWMAWLPIVNFFLLTKLVEEDVHELLKGKFTLTYGVVMIISFVLIPLWSLIAVFPYAMIMYAFYFIAKRYSNNEVLHTVIALITLGMAIPIQLFRFRNKEMIMAH